MNSDLFFKKNNIKLNKIFPSLLVKKKFKFGTIKPLISAKENDITFFDSIKYKDLAEEPTSVTVKDPVSVPSSIVNPVSWAAVPVSVTLSARVTVLELAVAPIILVLALRVTVDGTDRLRAALIFTFSSLILNHRSDYLIDLSLTSFSTLGFLFFTKWYLDIKKFSFYSALSGAALGLIFLTRPTGITIFFLPFVFIILKLIKRKSSLSYSLKEFIFFIIFFILIIFPWFSRNWLTIITSTINAWNWGENYQDGLEFSNEPKADDSSRFLEEGGADLQSDGNGEGEQSEGEYDPDMGVDFDAADTDGEGEWARLLQGNNLADRVSKSGRLNQVDSVRLGATANRISGLDGGAGRMAGPSGIAEQPAKVQTPTPTKK